MPDTADPGPDPSPDQPAEGPTVDPAAMLDPSTPVLPARVVLVFDETHVPRKGRRRRPAPFRRVADVTKARRPVAVVAAVGPGAPTAAITVEFMAHLGVEQLVAVGVAGCLTDEPPTATILAVHDAVSDEGTSGRYGAHHRADQALADLLQAATGRAPVTALTTDTPLAHHDADIEGFRASAQVMEMEAAALFAAASARGVACGSLVVASDHYRPKGWTLGAPGLVRPAVVHAVELAVGVLSGSPDRPRIGRP